MPLCPPLGTPVARPEVDAAVEGSRVPCGEAMEQKGQRSTAFRRTERTGDGEVKQTVRVSQAGTEGFQVSDSGLNLERLLNKLGDDWLKESGVVQIENCKK